MTGLGDPICDVDVQWPLAPIKGNFAETCAQCDNHTMTYDPLLGPICSPICWEMAKVERLLNGIELADYDVWRTRAVKLGNHEYCMWDKDLRVLHGPMSRDFLPGGVQNMLDAGVPIPDYMYEHRFPTCVVWRNPLDYESWEIISLDRLD